MELKSGEEKEFIANDTDRLTGGKEIYNKRKVEEVDFKCGQEFLDYLKHRVQGFEPFPSAETFQEFRRWEKSVRRPTLATIEEERVDHAKIKRDLSEQIDAEMNPSIRLMMLPSIHVWENFEEEKSKLWFGDQIKKTQTTVEEDNWFPVNWGEVEEEEEEDLFVDRELTPKTRKWFSFRRLFRHGNKKQKTPGCFSGLCRFFRGRQTSAN